MTTNEAQSAVLRALARETEYMAAVDLLLHDRQRHEAADRLLGAFSTSRKVGARLGQLVRLGLAERRESWSMGQYRITPAGRQLLGLPEPPPPQPEPEPARPAGPLRIVHRYQVGQLAIGVNERGMVGIGPAQLHPDAEVLTPVDTDQLHLVLEQARVDSHRILGRLHPQTRPFTSRVIAELNPQQTVTTSDVAGRANLTYNEAYAELLRLRDEGRVTKTGGRWAAKPLAGSKLEWHPGKHGWDTHGGYRRHAHSINGQLTIDPADTRVHFAGGLPFDN